MAHYVFLDEKNNVTEVILGRDEWQVINGITDWEYHYGKLRGKTCKKIIFNAVPGNNEAKNQFTYDESLDVFVLPDVLSAPYPEGMEFYEWDEALLVWQPAENGKI